MGKAKANSNDSRVWRFIGLNYLNSRRGWCKGIVPKRLASVGMTVITLALLMLLSIGAVHAATYTVNSTADVVPAVAGTLRWAIQRANLNPELDTIDFNISTADSGFNGQWWTINLSSNLPRISEDVIINGSTQTVHQGDTNPGQVGWSTTHPGFTPWVPVLTECQIQETRCLFPRLRNLKLRSMPVVMMPS